jgi:serine/threonine protein kinase
MKFFGYTHNRPDAQFVQQEIDLMWSMRGVDGALQLHGVFDDSSTGYLVPRYRKYFPQSYPVIVMDMGGEDLLTKISNQRRVSEQTLAEQFLCMIKALRSIHDERLIHRDLKPDNVLVSSVDEKKIYIIDFGLMKELPSGGDHIVEGRSPIGTAGYFAPESILNQTYSAKSDVWQAGCILYVMLNGGKVAPFVSKPQDISYRQITRQTYYPLVPECGFGATSAAAKDLVTKMLQKDPNDRISVEEILAHPWLNGHASTEELPAEYKRCIRATANRRKVKAFFFTRNVVDDTRQRAEYLTSNVIPNVLRQESLGSLGSNVDGDLDADSLKDLPQVNSSDMSFTKSAFYGRLKELKSRSQQLFGGGVDCDCFIQIMNDNELPEIASEEVFHMFDVNHDGVIELHEFLLALISFDMEDEMSAAKVYFNFFDMNDDGIISHDEFITMIKYILGDDHYSAANAEQYYTLAASQSHVNGTIDFEAFKRFYEGITTVTASQSAGLSTARPTR